MPPARLTLVIDQGTHATRAFAFDQEGEVQASEFRRIALHRRSAEVIEQDPEEIISSVQEVVEALLANPLVQRLGIAQAGLATQRSSVVAWDGRSGQALSPVISWQDRRAAEWLSRFEPQGERIKEKTGLPLSPHYGASKLRWLLDNVSEIKRAKREERLAFGPLASFLLFQLLGERNLQVDHANAARTLLWNIETRDWDPWLLSLFGVPRAALPLCRPISYEYGLLTGTEIPLTVVNGDQNAAVYGLGEPRPDTAIINLGTGAFVLLPTVSGRVHHPTLLCGLTSSDALEGEYTIEGTVNGAGAALAWAAETWQIPDIGTKMDEWLARPGDPPLFINTVGGLGSPWWQAGLTPTVIGDGLPWQYAVAVAESILFLLQANLEAMAKVGLEAKRIRVSGGLALLDGLCQRLADLTGRAVYRPAETEATARGAAWLAAGRPANWPETRPGLLFEPQANPPLSARYRQFLAELSALIN
ncbi:MAG: hypothetical protein JSW55_17865 [Chloroflexota bacterium]|nr:MAG: hypothetical protein JSW55_17865 [Chloroflexota bacterium]